MAAQIFNSVTDWLFTVPWWLTVLLAKPVIGCLFSNGGRQCLWSNQNWLPNLTLAGNQDTRIQYFFLTPDIFFLSGNLKKTNSIFKDIIQIEVDLPPSHPIVKTQRNST